ncbi:16S rRNA (cytosine(1402)-N(4))-methyltransferase RsmH [Holophaga foetida]|uniref:16S rRNA (cytosine(1402)-N(4))-methyltransferase RsmH n=1 Tax=Holophaga foetida TaxID=35839 RepID=UPI0002471C5A|nr:16S rRNA (cytosine(1402)-N(4))-methyltransferase RsmH [Holophaga foetida]
MTPTPIHVPVLLHEVLESLPVPPGGRVLDLTLGLGGHAEAILARCDADTRYLGVDRDPFARELAQARLGSDARFSILAGAHEEIWEDPLFEAWRSLQAPNGFDAILMDLGVSNLHLKTPARGFSFMEEGPLDMRMDPEHGETALQWISEQSDETLANAIYEYGEERASRPIARSILRAFNEGRLHTTLDLAQAIYQVLPREIAKRKKQIDPATRTFQAIRIAVNGELSRLEATLEQAVEALVPGGRLGVISFHSLEDRIVKHTFRRLAGVYDGPGRIAPQVLPEKVRVIHGNGLKAGDAELQANPPSRSARLRIAERLSETASVRTP